MLPAKAPWPQGTKGACWGLILGRGVRAGDPAIGLSLLFTSSLLSPLHPVSYQTGVPLFSDMIISFLLPNWSFPFFSDMICGMLDLIFKELHFWKRTQPCGPCLYLRMYACSLTVILFFATTFTGGIRGVIRVSDRLDTSLVPSIQMGSENPVWTCNLIMMWKGTE